jgi:hypothetical protein
MNLINITSCIYTANTDFRPWHALCCIQWSSENKGRYSLDSDCAIAHQGVSMKKNDKIRPIKKKTKTLLDELIEKKNAEDLGLLDLLFIEEVMNQKKQGKTK